MNKNKKFEMLLDVVCVSLTDMMAQNEIKSASSLENQTRLLLKKRASQYGFDPNQVDNHSQYGLQQIFPDINLSRWGVEVKYTSGDKWRCIGNSVNEGHRNPNVDVIYVLFGKAGGVPAVKWKRYDEAVVHVRTSHRLRFELDLSDDTQSLFKLMGLPYDKFSSLDFPEKMEHLRRYAIKKRKQTGAYIWWLPAETTKNKRRNKEDLVLVNKCKDP